MELNTDSKTNMDSGTVTENHVTNSEETTPSEAKTRQENQRRKAFKAIKLKTTIYHTKSQRMKHVVARISNAVTAQSWDREGRTRSKGPKESLTQQAERSEDNPEWLQQEKGKVDQANCQKGTLDDQTTGCMSIYSGNIRRTGVT